MADARNPFEFLTGDEICWVNNFQDPNSLRSGVVTKWTTSYLWVDMCHRPEDCILREYAWPASCRDALLEIITENQRLQRELDARMGLIYELRNKVSRGEL